MAQTLSPKRSSILIRRPRRNTLPRGKRNARNGSVQSIDVDRVTIAARVKGTRLFPKSWKELGMHCSCPDWAVPCKHLAAVVYIVANEIDKNPFLVFRMHGIDLLEAIRKTGRNATRYVNHLDLQEEPLAGSGGDGASAAGHRRRAP